MLLFSSTWHRNITRIIFACVCWWKTTGRSDEFLKELHVEDSAAPESPDTRQRGRDHKKHPLFVGSLLIRLTVHPKDNEEQLNQGISIPPMCHVYSASVWSPRGLLPVPISYKNHSNQVFGMCVRTGKVTPRFNVCSLRCHLSKKNIHKSLSDFKMAPFMSCLVQRLWCERLELFCAEAKQ